MAKGAPLDMTALTPEQLLELLVKAGAKQFTREDLERQLAAGAPQRDGRIHFVHYVAWLASQVK